MSEKKKREDVIWGILCHEASCIIKREPLLHSIIHQAILQHANFRDAVIFRLAHKLGGHLVTTEFLLNVFRMCFDLKGGEHFERLAMEDIISVEQRDPACKSIAEALLYFKGYKSIQAYRLSHILWVNNHQDLAMVIQMKCTEVFGVDIHPAAIIGGGLLIDHSTGVVIGETCIIGRNCSFLHGVTLGSTGTSTEHNRHPKIGHNVFLGCNVTILGNIHIGSHCKVGAGSLVLKSMPAGAIIVGSPAVVKSVNPQYSMGSQEEDSVTTLPLDSGLDVLGTPIGTASLDCNSDNNVIDEPGVIRLWTGVWRPKIWCVSAPLSTTEYDIVDPILDYQI
jgi:serine O-acetyltransferase